MKRKPLICGNWKMNTGIKEGALLVKEIVTNTLPPEVDVVIAPPFTHLYPLGQILKGKDISLCAQTMSQENFGAYTGEVAGEMLVELGIQYVILGHSERRAMGETDQLIHKKIEKALELGLCPIVCVGEDEAIKEKGQTLDFVLGQVEKAIENLNSQKVDHIILAYEPIWAIGTGKTAKGEDAQEVAQAIRGKVASLYPGLEKKLRILYGGSAKPENAASFLEMEDVDGLLIGGASLKAKDFIQMVEIGASYE